jgi:hypothetical protein
MGWCVMCCVSYTFCTIVYVRDFAVSGFSHCDSKAPVMVERDLDQMGLTGIIVVDG